MSEAYAQSGAARLDELEAKRSRYEALSRKLFTLPQKLRHAGLIPVGPRLYLPGELVNTNRLTVLLGSCNEEAYFAERSAFQAQGIVQRRLAVIGEKVKEVKIGEKELAVALREKGTENGKDGEDALLPGATVDVGRGTVKKLKKRVSFRDPVVTEVRMPENYKKKKGKRSGGNTAPSTRNQQSTAKQMPVKQKQSTEQLFAKQKGSAAKQSPSGKETSKIKNDSFASEPVAAKEASKTKNFSFVADHVAANETSKGSHISFASAPLAAKDDSGEATPSVAETVSSGKVPKDGVTLKEEQRAVRSQFDDAIQNAERQVLEQGVVNITEVYDDAADEPSRIELPAGFIPDETINFEDNSEDFLDMTGGKRKKPGDIPETASREDFWEALIAAEGDEEIEKARGKTEETERTIRSEEREFGKGFSKGFFGAPSVKASKPKAQAKPTAELSEKREVPQEVEPAPEVLTEDQVVPQRVETPSQPVIKEQVVERRSSRKGTRKTRKPRASSILEMRGMPATPNMPDAEPSNGWAGVSADDDVEFSNEAPVSKFRQIRNRQRLGPS